MNREDYINDNYEDLVVSFLKEKEKVEDFEDYYEEKAGSLWYDLSEWGEYFYAFLKEWNLDLDFDDYCNECATSYKQGLCEHSEEISNDIRRNS